MLEIKEISKYYNSKKILDDISFSVNKGRIFGIIGPNGAGKTTTLRIILGITNPASGQLQFNGKKLNQDFQNFTGYLPEERGLYPKSNVVNTLIYLAQLKGLKYSTALERTKYWLDRLNLLEFEKFQIEELSKGNQQKVQFISAILHDPEILVLDEPFSGFDPVNQSIFTQIIEELRNEKFIILSTHLMDLAENLCDEIILINEGKEVLSGKVSDILSSYQKSSYTVRLKNKVELGDLKQLFPSNKISKIDEFSVEIDLSDGDPVKFIREFSSNYEIIEFKRQLPSLHNVFVSLVDRSEKT